ncbi:MAG: hypothetical protein RL624_1259 [Bacteroidota bacterium]|jgi:hypothetical protein
METQIEKFIEESLEKRIEKPLRLYNPDKSHQHRVQSIEATSEYTRIDFVYRSSMIYINGGWIQMDAGAYIQPVGSATKYGLIKAVGIPIAPLKLYFKRQGQYHTYTLFFPPLPKDTTKINIIEKEAPGTFFNFYGIDYSNWMTVPHACDLPISNN